ncbi:MAG TPA: NUDIX hydrolase [Nannocystaceae bacterium]|nr:NUDIX hydrolase [Nannocystaceae bacterium]
MTQPPAQGGSGTVASAPRFAATVVIARAPAEGASASAEHAQIFMVRRSAKSPFMPSSLVFPGGRVDDADGDAGSDDAFARAARRECREEASLDLDDVELVWFDTWCTPSAEPRRYFTRFYLAIVPAHAIATADEYETHEGRWASAAAHLDAWTREEVDLPPPTLCTLLRLRDGGLSALRKLARDDLRAAILPKVMLDDARVQIVMPHDPAYETALGEGGPVPQRVHDLPRRFALTGKRWLPC